LSYQLADLISAHGYGIVAIVVALESMGIPAPGETVLVAAAVFAGTTQRLSIGWVIVAAAIGAIVGDNLGYVIGRKFGHAILVRFGHFVRIDEKRIKLGQYLFARHGGTVVFFGRFVAVLRALAALLAGINCMPWRQFLFFNAAGGVLWATAYGMAPYFFGERVQRLHGTVAVVGLALAATACVGAFWWLRRHEATLTAEAERALPGPLPRSSRRSIRPIDSER
jgi:membrane protein DedA with SNARE-associated domain